MSLIISSDAGLNHFSYSLNLHNSALLEPFNNPIHFAGTGVRLLDASVLKTFLERNLGKLPIVDADFVAAVLADRVQKDLLIFFY